jgi:hypothetical protein
MLSLLKNSRNRPGSRVAIRSRTIRVRQPSLPAGVNFASDNGPSGPSSSSGCSDRHSARTGRPAAVAAAGIRRAITGAGSPPKFQENQRSRHADGIVQSIIHPDFGRALLPQSTA